MTQPEAAGALAAYSVADLCSAHGGVRAMHSSLTPLFPGARICGPARTALIAPGQNAAIHRAVLAARAGEVLVVGGGDRHHGPFGEILAACCRDRGIAGLVIDGTIRDTAEIRDMRFPVFCMGASPTATGKSEPGKIDVEVDCAGVHVRPGDIVVGDDDGVVVVPKEFATEVGKEAEALVRWEESVKARIRGGETTCEIFGIESDMSRRQ